MRTGHVVISNKWGKQVIGRMKVNDTISMEIDMGKGAVVWHTSDGKIALGAMTKTLKKLNLVPFLEFQEAEDMIRI